jgi:hypothetical protein
MLTPLDVPELVRQRAMSNGIAGRRWLDDLPETVAALTDRWHLELGNSFRGGTAAFVAAAMDRAGRPCVLKVAMPLEIDDDSFDRSVRVHQLARGHDRSEAGDLQGRRRGDRELQRRVRAAPFDRDVFGYFEAGADGSRVRTIRRSDCSTSVTRHALRRGRSVPDNPVTLQVTGWGGVPPTATAVVLNVTYRAS